MIFFGGRQIVIMFPKRLQLAPDVLFHRSRALFSLLPGPCVLMFGDEDEALLQQLQKAWAQYQCWEDAMEEEPVIKLT